MAKAEVSKNKIQEWFADKSNVILVIILIFALILHIYFFSQTLRQPLWWDEAEYMAAAKHFAFNVPYDIAQQRTPVFQLLASIFFIVGLGEISVKFFLVLIPSVLLIFFVYLLAKEMYNKKIALVASLLTAASWTYLFWSSRVQPDFLSMCFQILSILFMWRYWKNPKTNLIVFSGIFAALGLLFKVSGLLVPLIFIVFILIKDRLSAFKNKDYYYFSLAFLLVLAPYFIWAYAKYHALGFISSGYSNAAGSSMPFGWMNFNYYYLLTGNALFILLILGILFALKFLLTADLLIKEKQRGFDPNIFSLLAVVIISAFYIFYMRYTEDRWVFLWLPFFFILIGNALLVVYNFVKKYSNLLGVIFVIFLLAYGIYSQLNQANNLIKNKETTYQQVMQAGLWMKANSVKTDSIATLSNPQTVYYAERKVYSYSGFNESQTNIMINDKKPKYFVASVFEPTANPSWLVAWLNKYQSEGKLAAVQGYVDSSKNPLLIIYEIKDYNF